ncbi:MAG: ATP-binding protein [Pseudomonadota bacterium]
MKPERNDDGAEIHHGRFASTDAAVQQELSRISALSAAGDLAEDRRDDMLIVLGEVLNNIVEHAFEGSDAGWIDCRISRCANRLCIMTRDEGRPLPPSLLTKGSLPDFGDSVDDLPEGGFGWFIIHSLVDDMLYERTGGQNLMSFTLALEREGG